MSDNYLIIRFEGLDAQDNLIEIQSFGQSLIGINRLVGNGLHFYETGECLKKGKLSPFLIKTKPPEIGSYELAIILAESKAYLPLIHDIILSRPSKILGNLLSGLLLKMGGREQDSTEKLNAVVDLYERINQDRADERRHVENVIDKLNPHARQVVYPIGKSSDNMVLEYNGETTNIDLPIADSIRSKERLEVGEMETIETTIDGIFLSQKQIKIPHPTEIGKYTIGRVSDPVFLDTPNIYTDALSNQKPVKLTAKIRKNQNGIIKDIYVLNAEPI